MIKRQLGTSSIYASPIIFGCWQAAWTGVSEDDIISANIAAFEAGITTFDTAEGYGSGHSERVLAKSLGDKRDQLIIATKVSAHNLSREKVFAACEGSLKNLNTDYIDLYQVHWPSGTWGSPIVPIEETMAALAELKEQGKIRAIGVSNFNAVQLAEAIACTRVDTLQPPYSLFWRMGEMEVFPFARKHHVSILAYSPLAQGLLTGKFGPDTVFDKDDVRSGNRLFQPENYARAQEALGLLRKVADRHSISPGSLALSWLLYQPDVLPIVGARTPAQAQDNVKCLDVVLSPFDLADIDAAGRIVTDHLNDDPILWG
jgi:aryl-alcohol dehydrogenase-like predicted oxidoreductase